MNTHTIKSIPKSFGFELNSKWFFLGALVGVISGLGAVFFQWLLTGLDGFFLGKIVGYSHPIPIGEGGEVIPTFSVLKRWLLLLIPAIGGLLTGIIVYGLAPEAEGHGTDFVIESFHRMRGVIRSRVPIIKTIASALTIGTGGSAGREGPIAQIGAGFASWLSNVLKLSDRDRRILLLAGAGGGIGAIFRAPLGGALFAAEVLYRQAEFETESVIPSIISAIVAYAVYGFFYTWSPIFDTFAYQFNVKDLPLSALLGFLVVPFGFMYVTLFYKTRDFFKKLHIPNFIKPAIGGILVGVVLYFFPYVAGTSYGWVQVALYGQMAAQLMLGIAIVKMVVTSFTIGSGGSGGVFAPSIVIGAMIGGAFGKGLYSFFPDITTSPTSFVLIGMGSFFASVAKVPLSTLVMVAEMTGNYDLLVPLTLASAIAFLLSGKWSIYEKQVGTRIDSPAHKGEFIVDILEEIKIKDAIKLPKKLIFLSEDLSITDALRRAAQEKKTCFPVVDKEGNLKGVLYTEDLRTVLFSGEMEDLKPILVVGDIVRENIPVLTVSDDLHKALTYFTQTGLDELPVFSEDGGQCVGTLSRKDLMHAYDREIIKRKMEE
jgi:CIC family chloride channel protein